MGCNSSAPNIVTPTATPVQIDELTPGEAVVIKKKSSHGAEAVKFSDDTNQIKVLPTCDNLNDSIQLAVDNNYSDVDHAPVVDSDKGDKEKGHNNHANVENKLSTMEEVVDKVVELYRTPDKDIARELDDNTHTRNENKQNTTLDIKENTLIEATVNDKDSEVNSKDNDEMETDNLAFAEEHKSPEKSKDKIVTRWEALADIAAELPPLLAIDPVTGQIYSLSK